MVVRDLLNAKKYRFIYNGGSFIKRYSKEVKQAIHNSIKNKGHYSKSLSFRTKCIEWFEDTPLVNVTSKNILTLESNLIVSNPKKSNSFLYKIKHKRYEQ